MRAPSPKLRVCRLVRLDCLLGLDEVVRCDGERLGFEAGEQNFGEEGAAGRLLLDGCEANPCELRITK